MEINDIGDTPIRSLAGGNLIVDLALPYCGKTFPNFPVSMKIKRLFSIG
jgi:hypothetical protein